MTYGEAPNDHLWLSLVLIVLILVTGMFSYYQESKSTRIMESFQEMLPERAKILRDGERKELLVTELVVGDIVLLEIGDRVPADIRILECQGKTCVSHRVGISRFSADRKKRRDKPFSLLNRESLPTSRLSFDLFIGGDSSKTYHTREEENAYEIFSKKSTKKKEKKKR